MRGTAKLRPLAIKCSLLRDFALLLLLHTRSIHSSQLLREESNWWMTENGQFFLLTMRVQVSWRRKKERQAEFGYNPVFAGGSFCSSHTRLLANWYGR